VRTSGRLSFPVRAAALGLALLAASAALLAACAGGAPDIFLEEEQLDLGTVQNGEVRSFEVAVTNQGSRDLVIEAVSTSCGCTTARVIPTTLRPGESGSLQVTFDAGAHGPEERGSVIRQVFIASNDPDQPELEFRLTADILPASP
jgi:hypothetical protein